MIKKALIYCLISFIPMHLFAAPTRDGVALVESGKVRRWKNLPVRICLTSKIPENVASDFKKAAIIWNETFGKKVFDVGCKSRVTDFDRDDSNEHSVFWITKNFEKTGDALALARTLSSFNEDTGEMVDTDILINADKYNWKTLKVDVKSIFVHELGHVLGLQHLFISTTSVMNQYPYQSGIIRHKLGEYETQAIKKLYFGSPESPASYFDAYFGNDFVRALELIRKSKSRDTDSFYAEGCLSIKTKDFAGAITALKKSVELNPQDPLARYRLAEAYILQDKPQESATQLEQLLKMHPNFYEALADLALIRMQNGNRKEAISLFQKTLTINPAHYPACYMLLDLTKDKKYKACLEKFAPSDI